MGHSKEVINGLGWLCPGQPGAEGGGVKGGKCPLELPKFLLTMTVHCIEMYYLPLYTKDKKNFPIYCYMFQNSTTSTNGSLRLL